MAFDNDFPDRSRLGKSPNADSDAARSRDLHGGYRRSGNRGAVDVGLALLVLGLRSYRR